MTGGCETQQKKRPQRAAEGQERRAYSEPGRGVGAVSVLETMVGA